VSEVFAYVPNWNRFINFKNQQIRITCDDAVSFAAQRAGKNGIVVNISRYWYLLSGFDDFCISEEITDNLLRCEVQQFALFFEFRALDNLFKFIEQRFTKNRLDDAGFCTF